MSEVSQADREKAAEEYRASTGWDMAEGHAIREAFVAGSGWRPGGVEDNLWHEQINAERAHQVEKGSMRHTMPSTVSIICSCGRRSTRAAENR
jgi:hypothetical protein